MVTLVDEYGIFVPLSNVVLALGIGITVAVLLAFYVLRSLGLYTLAKRNDIEKPYISFIPFFWIYIACKLAGNVKLFNTSLAKLALYVGIFFTSSALISGFVYIVAYFPLFGYFLQGGEITVFSSAEALQRYTAGNSGQVYYFLGKVVVKNINYPYSDLQTIGSVIEVLSRISSLMQFITTLVSIIVYINLFKRFWPEHFILCAVLSTMGLFAPFVFAIRNKHAVNYEEYIRSKFASYGSYDGRNGGSYRNEYKDPFGDYSDKQEDDQKDENGANDYSGDPFSEFSDKEDKH